jgi:hypothetical protein
MHPEQAGSTAVADDAPISPAADTVLISTDSKEAGLWLWQGEIPSPSSVAQPKPRGPQILRRIMPAARWAGWVALPTGVAFISIAVTMMPHPNRPVSTGTPTDAPSSVPSPAVAPSSAPSPSVAPSSASSPSVAPPVVGVPRAEPTTARLNQVQVSSAPTAKIAPRGPEPRIAKLRAHRKPSRTERKIHASQVHKGPLFPIPGVLTPPP